MVEVVGGCAGGLRVHGVVLATAAARVVGGTDRCWGLGNLPVVDHLVVGAAVDGSATEVACGVCGPYELHEENAECPDRGGALRRLRSFPALRGKRHGLVDGLGSGACCDSAGAVDDVAAPALHGAGEGVRPTSRAVGMARGASPAPLIAVGWTAGVVVRHCPFSHLPQGPRHQRLLDDGRPLPRPWQ